MAETLLSPSNVLLFGRVMEDLTISPPLDFPPNTKNAALTLPDNFDVTQDIPETVDGEKSKGKSRFFLKVNNQHQEQIGIYKRINKTKKLERVELNK